MTICSSTFGESNESRMELGFNGSILDQEAIDESLLVTANRSGHLDISKKNGENVGIDSWLAAWVGRA